MGKELTQTNSFRNTRHRLVPGAKYIAKTPAGPLGVNNVDSSVPAADRSASTCCGEGLIRRRSVSQSVGRVP